MIITREFDEAVRTGNILRVRIMLKDSLLVDKSFVQFGEMLQHCKQRNLIPWSESSEAFSPANQAITEDAMNYELTLLVNDFTVERVNYLKQLITKLYPVQQKTASNPTEKRLPPASENVRQQPFGLDSLFGPKDDYEVIVDRVNVIYGILRHNGALQGSPRWMIENIDAIKKAAKDIFQACKTLQDRGMKK